MTDARERAEAAFEQDAATRKVYRDPSAIHDPVLDGARGWYVRGYEAAARTEVTREIAHDLLVALTALARHANGKVYPAAMTGAMGAIERGRAALARDCRGGPL